MLAIISPSLAEGKERKAGGAVVGCSSPGTVPTDAATLWFPSCHFTGVAGEAVPAARAATSLGHGGDRECLNGQDQSQRLLYPKDQFPGSVLMVK